MAYNAIFGPQYEDDKVLASQALDLSNLDLRDEERSKKPEAVEHTKTLQLFCDNEERTVNISLALATEENNMLVRCLKVSLDVFSWSIVDMLWVDLG